jgi:hypothetical protein
LTIRASVHRIVATTAILVAIILVSISFAPAHAQSLDEMKAQLKAMQKRIEQLEAVQRTSPPPAQPRGRTATTQTADV